MVAWNDGFVERVVRERRYQWRHGRVDRQAPRCDTAAVPFGKDNGKIIRLTDEKLRRLERRMRVLERRTP
jgi:hypothetical protein